MVISMKLVILLGLLTGFYFLYLSISESRLPSRVLVQTRESLETAARQRSLQGRSRLRFPAEKPTVWKRLEQSLDYSGLALYHPLITVETWCLGSVLLMVVGFSLVCMMTKSIMGGLSAIVVIVLAEVFLCEVLARRNLRILDGELLKFLDFLGNYSITAGEVTGIFKQVARYVEDPLQTVLERCYLEAQTTGDVELALLSMAERIEHPKFKELIRNMEIGIRYSADFSVLVQSSRRSIREYQQMKEQRRSLQRESFLNMILLLGMSAFVLLTVDQLITTSIWEVVLYTIPGKIAMFVVGIILLLFMKQINKSDR